MKKMVCDICGSQSIKKENDVFVCQECGTEYTHEEAKKLLKEIGDKQEQKDNSNENENIDRFKLKYDLLCWHNFYEKCHELENSFEIKDDLLVNCSDTSSPNYTGDITKRTIEYDKSNENYFNEKIVPTLKKKYISNKEVLMTYYNEAKNSWEKSELLRVASKNSAISSGNSLKTLGLVLAISGVIPIVVDIALVASKKISFFGCLGLLALIVPIEIIALFITSVAGSKGANIKTVRMDQKVSMGSFQSYEEWADNNIDDIDIYKNYLNQKKELFFEIARKEERTIVDSISQLKQIKNELESDIPMPKKYSDEYHINALLALVLDRRADTLKEAINLFETETYRSTVVLSLDMLNHNIQILNNNITGLRKEVYELKNIAYEGFKTVIRQNNFISMQLDSIRFDTRYLMIDSLLS